MTDEFKEIKNIKEKRKIKKIMDKLFQTAVDLEEMNLETKE